jgi:hypothetical protein
VTYVSAKDKGPAHWEAIVQESLEKDALARLQTCVRRERPFGSEDWVRKTAGEMAQRR